MTGLVYAVIFDIDGVLVDSYDAHLNSWQAVARRKGLEMTEAEFAATFGRTSRAIIQELWSAQITTDEQITAIDDEKEAAYRDIIRSDFPVMAGARDLIAALLDAQFRLAVGSSGPPENVQLTLEHVDPDQRFGGAVSGADVRRGKPDPEVFQLCAQRLDVPPQCCAVIEDARAGIEAAHAAGMTSIGLVSTGHYHDELAAADLVVDRLDELSVERITELIEKTSSAKNG